MKFAYDLLKGTDDLLNRIIDAIMIIFLLISLYLFIDAKIIFDGVSSDKITQYKPDNAQASKELVHTYKDYVFWLEIADSPVSFPVVQGENNSKYLNTAPDGSYSLSGSIFLDAGSSPDLTDKYSIIYGHHMANNAFFGSLDLFKDKTYFDSHRQGYFLTKDGEWIDFELFAFSGTDSSEQIIFNINHPADRVEWARENADIFVEPSVDGEVVCLSTCVSPSSTKRTIILVMLKERYQSEEHKN